MTANVMLFLMLVFIIYTSIGELQLVLLFKFVSPLTGLLNVAESKHDGQ